MNQLKKLTAMHLVMMGIMQSQMLFKAGVDAKLWDSDDYDSCIANELQKKIGLIEKNFNTVATQLENEDMNSIRQSLVFFNDDRNFLLDSLQKTTTGKELIEPIKEYMELLNDMITTLEDICR